MRKQQQTNRIKEEDGMEYVLCAENCSAPTSVTVYNNYPKEKKICKRKKQTS